MLVTRKTFNAILSSLREHSAVGLDCETTGLHWWRDKLFSIIITSPLESYYFNWNLNGGEDEVLDVLHFEVLKTFFANPDRKYYIANAKFDMHMLFNELLEIAGEVICISARERVIRNDHFPGDTQYALDALSNRYLKLGKDESVEEYIFANKLFTRMDIPGKKKEAKILHFDKVPLDVIAPYGAMDGRLHLNVGLAQEKAMAELEKQYGSSNIYGSIRDVERNEIRLTKTCFRMEREGIKIDVGYTKEAMVHEQKELVGLKSQFKSLTGIDYVDSGKCFVPAFERLGLTYPLTEKGNPSFKAEVLDAIENPVADLIKGVRHYEKRIGTYYSSFLYFRDANDFVHPNIKQGGTETGRMSYADPNLQNVPKEDDDEDLKKPYLVRGCFIPDDDESCLVSIDWKQQEFRMLLDYAGEDTLIEAINNGADPHQATADETGLSRRASKTINFGLIYGMGDEKLARALGVAIEEAQEMKAKYFHKMRKVQKFIKRVNGVAKTRQYGRNWFGRVCHIKDTNYSYVLLNHLIQGGCADVCKIAMNLSDDMLLKTKSKLKIQVHDELLFNVKRAELDIVPALSAMMDKVYKPQNGMLLTTSVSHSWKSWSKKDMVEGAPVGEKVIA